MDRKFINENCKRCWSGLDVFGLWCFDSRTKENGMKMLMCSAVQECPYKVKNPSLFERGYHLRQKRERRLQEDDE